MKIIDDMFEGQAVTVGWDGDDITKMWVTLGHVATFWSTDVGWARLALAGAPEGRGSDWLGTTHRVDDTGLRQPIEIVYFPGIVYLGTQIQNAKGDRFIVHLCEVVIPRALQGEEVATNVPAVIQTVGEADPFPAILALVHASQETRTQAMQGIAIGTRANDRIDRFETRDRSTARGYAMTHGFPTDNARTAQHPQGYLGTVGIRAAQIARQMRIKPEKIDHDHFPGGVHTWPDYVWQQAFEQIHDD